MCMFVVQIAKFIAIIIQSRYFSNSEIGLNSMANSVHDQIWKIFTYCSLFLHIN